MTTALRLARGARTSRSWAVLNDGDTSTRPPDADRIDLVAALRRLGVRQRQATILFYVGDLPVIGIAELMGVSEGTVKAHLAQARTALRRTLEASDV